MGTQWRSKQLCGSLLRIRLGLFSGWDSWWGSGARALTTGQDPQPCVWVYAFFEKRFDALIRFSEEFMTHKRLRSVALKGVRRQSPGRQRMKNVQSPGSTGVCLANMQSRHDWKFTFMPSFFSSTNNFLNTHHASDVVLGIRNTAVNRLSLHNPHKLWTPLRRLTESPISFLTGFWCEVSSVSTTHLQSLLRKVKALTRNEKTF